MEKPVLITAYCYKYRLFPSTRYFEREDYGGESHQIRWQEVPFATSQPQRLERFALAGNKAWHGWMQDSMEDLHAAGIRFCETQHQQLAHQWIRQGNSRASTL